VRVGAGDRVHGAADDVEHAVPAAVVVLVDAL
jgi:hypothetical protein